jgi:hypothetical protein
MKTMMRGVVSLVAVSMVMLCVAGCQKEEKAAEEPPTGEHPAATAPKAEHPKAEKPEAEHPKGDHPAAENPKK